ncbi:MAG: hypothetical protein A2268_02275 [Candidatus Raymondbacteria bacterium RifOxyA12_full_50_37]|uniref:Secretin/TonB short N-terminal domain-containing protein n=1 Tax=Candidatus Raymondbacteria bacterium RIFOXYD12_FULL_49_13 TaxID=1817890 RepID=A0A1F7F5L6_UNCRA|nr:MAG: hypothetical protein A2350_07800 [Candidatus Raymondbacteria bacterium RifOxyB12_full_50_8]OGJ91281.1 MAG: hypothetical protein A2268_02275 [Candidatus Raymondbacteria bacterium RifOxyA12_full_50_37]OGJ92251.1 MAG: hypothetical protein A2248_11105 [Candidatus Raymondbacteria bacterium RIFOXYA2_FULL_49_16]OGJ98577.1 MAG: hypothetical protein A2453_06905 [Candidatus Raymondbacteria bacterium RIFOXYC2_FULL_50_21]OGK01878.1 MAG: hypothetical protein A2519_04800 [Candidatus Raymondbacteria b
MIKFMLVLGLFICISYSQNLGPTTSDSLINKKELLPVPDSVTIPEMNFKDADIRDVLRTLGMQYGLNIWLSPDVRGNIPVNFKNIKVKDAIDFIITKYGYYYKVRNGIVEVFKPTPPLPPAPQPLPCVVRLVNGQLSMDLKQASIDTVVRLIMHESNENIIVEKGITGTLTCLLNNVDLDKGLVALFESNGLEIAKKNNIYYVTRPVWVSSKDESSSRSRLAIYVDSGKVKMEVTDAGLSEVVNIISSRAGISIFVYGKLDARISAKVENYISVDDALKYLLTNTKYSFWKEKGIYFIGEISSNAVNTAELVKLKYMKAEDISKLLPEAIMKSLKVNVLKEQNGIIFVGTYDYISSAKEFIHIVDQPVAQILIEALVVDFSISRARNIGVKLFTGSGDGNNGNSFFPGINITATGQDINTIRERPISDYFSLKQITKLPTQFRAQISALEQEGLANVVSTPQVATLNGHTATILIGTTQYFLLKTATTTTGVNAVVSESEHFEQINADVSLTVTPWLTGDQEVTVEVTPSFHIPGISVSDGIPPPINKREIKSVVRLHDGETYVLGGLIEQTDRKTVSGVPYLSKIPFIGWFFRTNKTEHQKNRMMIFLTPHIYFGNEGAVDKEQMIKSLQE